MQRQDIRRLMYGLATIVMIVAIIFFKSPGVLSQGPNQVPLESQLAQPLPAARVHPLPESLAAWQDPKSSGDYFDQINPLEVGYPIWSTFPLKLYIEPLQADLKAEPWVRAVSQAIQEWNKFLPLQQVNHPEQADITFWRSPLPIQFTPQAGRATGRPERVRSAETRFEVFITPATSDGPAYLKHRAAIRIRPNQTEKYLQAAARHELGHALGIWGHSPQQTDVMYYAQVRNPQPISSRDLNTLRKIYEQPTQLGWPLPTSSNAR